MKKELKTLKDFEATLIDWKESDGFWINLEEVRAEAIKWVKCSLGYGIGEFESMDDYERIMNWIKHFFNLTEEDLKNEKRI